MKIKNLTITSPSTLDLELDITTPVCVFRGKHSALALDLIRELIGDYGAATDPDAYDDGRFVIHSDIEMDGKNYNVCYIRNADFMGDNRIAANFAKNGLAFSEDDTLDFLEKCNARDKHESNAIYDYKIFTATEDDRPLCVYCEDGFAHNNYLYPYIVIQYSSNGVIHNDSMLPGVFYGKSYDSFANDQDWSLYYESSIL
jgi:hypothetical protein